MANEQDDLCAKCQQRFHRLRSWQAPYLPRWLAECAEPTIEKIRADIAKCCGDHHTKDMGE